MIKKLERRKLHDFFKVRRAAKDEIFPKGTLYIQVSAVNHNDKDSAFKLTQHCQTIESKYVVLEPIYAYSEGDIMYFYYMLNSCYEAFFHKIIGEKINIAMSEFCDFEFDHIIYPQDREQFLRFCLIIENNIQVIENEIEQMGKIKTYLLDQMFV